MTPEIDRMFSRLMPSIERAAESHRASVNGRYGMSDEDRLKAELDAADHDYAVKFNRLQLRNIGKTIDALNPIAIAELSAALQSLADRLAALARQP